MFSCMHEWTQQRFSCMHDWTQLRNSCLHEWTLLRFYSCISGHNWGSLVSCMSGHSWVCFAWINGYKLGFLACIIGLTRVTDMFKRLLWILDSGGRVDNISGQSGHISGVGGMYKQKLTHTYLPWSKQSRPLRQHLLDHQHCAPQSCLIYSGSLSPENTAKQYLKINITKSTQLCNYTTTRHRKITTMKNVTSYIYRTDLVNVII